MDPKTTPVLLIGPGAIGAFTAAHLVRAGFPVTVACRTKETAAVVKAQGLVAEDHERRRLSAKVDTVAGVKRLKRRPQVVLLATKCADAAGALAPWLPHVAKDGTIIALQNGLMGDTLAPLAPGRLVDTVVHFPASLQGPGHSIQTGPGGFDAGAWPTTNGPSCSLEHVARAVAVLSHAAPTQAQDNMPGAKWTKLIINSCITTLGALTGRQLGELLSERRARDAFLAITTEGRAAGRAAGVTFEPIQRFHPDRFALPPDAGGFSRGWRDAALRVLARKYRNQRSSSLQSLERGAKTEVDYLNGAIVATGDAHAVETPVNQAIVALVHAIEAGTARPGPELLADLPLA